MADHLLRLSHDEALVAFELLARFEETNALSLQHNAEFLVLSTLSGQLQKLLVEPFEASYSALLAEARARVASGYEGTEPGVSGGEV